MLILDYNHEKITWKPAVVPSMAKFYQVFLQWREEMMFEHKWIDKSGSIQQYFDE